jgi:serine O-acetyltransferase
MMFLQADFQRYRETGHSMADIFFSRGFQAVVSYRFRNWLISKHIPFIHVIIGYFTEVITNVEIPANVTIGKGLVIYHGGPVIINGNASLGENIGLRPGVVIGGDYHGDGAPTLSSNIEIGVGAKILGGIHLGENTKVGANAVVTKSFPSNSVLVGIPAVNIAKEQR